MAKKEIARREVGLGLNISSFARSAKTAEELLEQITEGRSVSLDARLNLGDTQAILQKVLDQKTVSIKTAIDVKDLIGIMESAIGDFEQQGSRSLAAMNRSFLDGFKNGLDGVEFRLDDGSLVRGYEAAIIQAEKLVDVNAAQAKIADTVSKKMQQQTNVSKKQVEVERDLTRIRRKRLNMEYATKRYNDLMSLGGREHKQIGESGTENWNLRDMISEVQSLLDTYSEDGHVNGSLRYGTKEEKKMWRSETDKLQRFIDSYKEFVGELQTAQNHLSKWDNTLQSQAGTAAVEQRAEATKHLASATDKAKKTMQDFMALWNKVAKNYTAEDFGKKYSYLMAAISGESPTMSIDDAYHELQAKEKEHQKLLEESAKKREAIGRETQEFLKFAAPMEDQINASEIVLKEFASITQQLSNGTLNAADAIKRMQAVMKDNSAAEQLASSYEETAESAEQLSSAVEKTKTAIKAIKSENGGRALKSFDFYNMTPRTKNKELREIKEFARARWQYKHRETQDIPTGFASFIKQDGSSFEVDENYIRMFDVSGKLTSKAISEMSKSAFDKLMSNVVYAIFEDDQHIDSYGTEIPEKLIDTQFGNLSSYIAKDDELYSESRKYVAAYREEVQKLHGALRIDRSAGSKLREDEITKYETLVANPEDARKYYEERQRIEREARVKRQEFNELEDPYIAWRNRPEHEQMSMLESDTDKEIKLLEARIEYHKKRKQLIQESIDLSKEYQTLPLQYIDSDDLIIDSSSTDIEQEYIESYDRKLQYEKDKLVQTVETSEQVVEKLKEYVALRKKQAALYQAGENTDEYLRPIRDIKVALLGGMTDSKERSYIDTALDASGHLPDFKFDDIAKRISSGLGIKDATEEIKTEADSIEQNTVAFEKNAKTRKKIAGLIQRYNDLVFDIDGSGDMHIGNSNTAGWKISNIIKSLEVDLESMKFSDIGAPENAGQKYRKSMIGKLERLIKAFKPYASDDELAISYLPQIQAETKAIEERTQASQEYLAAQQRLLEIQQQLKSYSGRGNFARGATYAGKDGRLVLANRLGSELYDFGLKPNELNDLIESTYDQFSKVRNLIVDRQTWNKEIRSSINESMLAESMNGIYTVHQTNLLGKQDGMRGIVEQVRSGTLSIADALSQINDLAVKTNIIQERWQFGETRSGQVSMFTGMSDPIEEAVDTAKELGQVLEEVVKIPGQISFDEWRKLVYHAGDLSNIENTLKSFPLGNVPPRKGSGISGLTGLYTTEDVTGFWGNEWHGAPISTIDISQYRLLDAGTNKIADNIGAFLDDLNATIYGYYEAVDEKDWTLAKHTDVKTIDELYVAHKELFAESNLTIEQFAKFIQDATARIAGKSFADIDLPAIDEGIAKSGISSVLQDVSEELFNSDSFKTMFLKMLGYEGVDVRGTKYNGTYTGGTVLFDVKKDSLQTVNEKWSDVMSRSGYEISEDDLQYEEKRRQLAFDTAKAYRKQADEAQILENRAQNLVEIASQTPQESNTTRLDAAAASRVSSQTDELYKFDALIKPDIADISVDDDSFWNMFYGTYEDLSKKIQDGALSAHEAYIQFADTVGAFWKSTAGEAENVGADIRKLSSDERLRMFDGVSFKQLFSQNNISKEAQNDVYDELAVLGDMVVSNDADVDDQIARIVATISQSARAKREDADIYLPIMSELKKTKILYDQKTDSSIVGKNVFSDIKKTLGSMMTPDREKANLRIDEYFDNLSEDVRAFLISEFESQHKVQWSGSEADIWTTISDVVKKSKTDQFRALSDDELQFLTEDSVRLISRVVANVERMRDVEAEVHQNIERSNELREESVRLTDQMEDSADEALSIIERDVNEALKQLRDAKDNKTNLIDLTKVSSVDDLETELRQMVSGILGDESKLSIDSVIVKDDIASIRLYSKELGVAATQTYRLEKATEDATEAQLKYISSSYKHSPRAQKEYSEAQQKKIDSDNRWLVQQLSKLDTQERKYKYSGKKIDGSTALERADETTLAQDADQTIDSLVAHIKHSINGAMSEGVTDSLKNNILNDLRILDNEIKVQQYKQYASTTMKPTELEEAKKEMTYMLDTLEAKAKKNNVFTQMSQDIGKLRNDLGAINDGAELGSFVDRLRTTKSQLTSEIAKAQQTKTAESNYQNLLKAQEKLYEAKKKLAVLQVKGEADSVDGQKVQKDVADLQEKCDAVKKLVTDQEKLNAATSRGNELEKELNATREKAESDNIKSIYQEMLSVINQINNLDVKMNDLTFKDQGTGLYSGVIENLQAQKAYLANDLNQLQKQLETTLSITPQDGQNIFSEIFSDARVQAALTVEEVQNINKAFMQTEDVRFNFGAKLTQQIQPVVEKVAKLKQLIESGAITDANTIAKVQGMDAIIHQQSQSSNMDELRYNAISLMEYVNYISDDVSKTLNAANHEMQYFANKKQYANISKIDDYSKTVNDIENISESAVSAKQKLESFVNTFADGKAVITGFTTNANGISKIDFSVLEEGTNQFRTFSAEMGTYTNNIYTIETSMNNLHAGTDAAKKSLTMLSEAMARLNQLKNGNPDFNLDDQTSQLWQRMQDLQKELASVGDSKDAASQTKLKNLAAEALKVAKQIAKMEKQWDGIKADIEEGRLTDLGTIDQNGDVYAQMYAKIQAAAGGATISNVKFDESTKTLSYTLTDADKNVKDITAHMDKLTGTVVIQEGQVRKLKNWWQDLGSGLGNTKNELVRYVGNMLDVASIIQSLRQGFNVVLEIDTALTELRKVTDETDIAYQRFLQNMSKSGAVVGSTVKDLTTSAADWARLNI